MTPKKTINTKAKTWTLLGLTALTGDCVMCVLISSKKRPQELWETGMDIFAKQIGEVSNDDYFIKNSGKGKRYHGGPTCSF